MLCEHCRSKTSSRKKVKITCKKCGQEAVVSVYNNNCCEECNTKEGVCEECGRKLENKDNK